MATKTLRVFAEYTSTGFVPMPTAGNIDYGYTLGSTFPATTPTTFQTDNPDLVVTVTAMTDFYVWIRINGTAWNPSYTRNVRVYPDSPNINNVVMNMIIATGPAGVGAYTQLVQTSNRLYFNGATTDSIYNSKFAGKTYINELNFGTAPGLATVATSGAYADLTGKPSLATVATSGLFTDLSSKPSGTAPLSYNSGTNSFVITQANTSTNGYLSSTDWNTFNNKFSTPSGSTLQYVDGTGALQTFPLLASADKLVINVRNSSGVSMPKGSVVYINGATGNKPTVALAQANSDASSAQTLGLLQATLANNAEGNVVIVGSVIDLNTSAFTEGQQLYLSPTTAGAYTATKQYAPNHLVYVGVVTRSHVSLGTIDVKVQNGYEMDELHNVSAQSPSNNDGLFYNTTTSLWEKKSIATVLGYTPYNGTDTSIKALFSASAPLSYSNGVYSISQATTASNGYLSSTDWNTFNGKESALTFSTPLVRTTNTISINQASASTSGFLSSTDWNTFNNKGSGSGTVTSVAMTVPTGLSISGTPITTSGTLALSLTAGYVIPTTSSASNWDTAYTNRITSLTVTGSSGSATLVSNVLNIPTYTLVGLGGQAALNGTGFVKISGTTISYDNSTYLTTASASSTYQTIITNPVTGTGTINELAYWNSASSIASLAVATYPSLTELAYVKGVTSAIQTQLNAKASTLSGTTNYIPKFISSSTIGNSLIYDDGTAIGIGTITPKSYSSLTINGQIIGIKNIGIDINQSFKFNSYYNSGTTTDRTISTGYGGSISLDQSGGGLVFATSSTSITADNNITNTERMRLTATGNLGIANSSPTSLWQGQFLQIGANLILGRLTTNGFSYFGHNVAYNGSAFKSINGGTGLLSGFSGTEFNIDFASGAAAAGDTYSTFARAFTIANTGYATFNGNVFVSYSSSTVIANAFPRIVISNTNATQQDYNISELQLSAGNGAVSGGLVASYSNSFPTSTPSIMLRNNGNSPLYFSTNGTVRQTIAGGGNVGIGITSPSQKLSVQGDANNWTTNIIGSTTAGQSLGLLVTAGLNSNDVSFLVQKSDSSSTYFQVKGNGAVVVGGSVDNGYKLYVAGSIYATGNITANSDLTLKKNLKLIDNPIDKLMQLNGYAYQWKANDEHQYGVIAQEVEKILPYAVTTGTNGLKGVSYNQIIPVLIEAIKNQQAEINTLKSKFA